VLPPAHFGYLATGVDDDVTVGINHEAYSHLEIRSRRLVDVSKLDTSVQLFGTTWETPIFMCRGLYEGLSSGGRGGGGKSGAKPAPSSNTFDSRQFLRGRSDGGAASAGMAAALSNERLERDAAIIKRAEAAGSPVLVLTTDIHVNSSNRETIYRARRVDNRDCSVCHEKGTAGYLHQSPMFDGMDIAKVTGLYDPSLTWDFVKRLKDATKMKLILKAL